MSDPKLQPILNALASFGIDDKFFIAAILANLEKESGLIPREENLNYSTTSNDRIRKIFTSRVSAYSDHELSQLKQDKEIFAELVYGYKTKVGQSLGNLVSGDGYRYRGRGYIQLTGKNNYKHFGTLVGVDLIKNPDLLIDNPEISAKISIKFIIDHLKKRNFTSLEEAIKDVTQVVGGRGLNLYSGYGAEILTKVRTLAQKYI